MQVRFDDVSIKASGHTVLERFGLSIEAGSHVAIVGPSGAGKSSLVGLLLGWHKPASGQILIDGVQLDGECLEELRKNTAWLDPGVQLWNRSLLDNIQYGFGDYPAPPLTELIEEADLRAVLERLPDTLQTQLGEGGALLSAG